MKLFDFLENLHRESEKIKIVPVEQPKKVIPKIIDIKEYKRQYYLQNLEVYRERNKNYRIKQKKLKNINI
jgi:hypothetical protein